MIKTSIAFVDDHQLMRKGLVDLINGYDNYEVIIEADNGQDFIQKLQPHNLPEIVLMDIEMPVMNGYEATSWLQQRYTGVKVIAISGIYVEFAIAKMIHSGACAFIPKDADPFEFKITLDAVQQSGFYFGGVQGALVKQVLQPSKYRKPQFVTDLSEEEIVFLRLCGTSLGSKEIALRLKKSEKQTEYLQTKLTERLGLRTRPQLAVFAVENGL